MDRVSVALCTYNGERFLGEQLASIAAQTVPPAELVVTDDASSDGTLALLEAFAARAPFSVSITRNRQNQGSTASFEQTLTRCTAPLVALCDQDDVWRPHKLERMAAAMQSKPGFGYAFSDADVVDQTLQPLGFRVWETVGFAHGGHRRFEGLHQVDQLLERTRVTGATMLVRAEYLTRCLPFPRGIVHDRWLATVLSATGAYGVTVDEPLVLYRQHAGQQIGVVRSGRPRSLREQVGRDFVLRQRRRIRAELLLGRAFIDQLDRLLTQAGSLQETEAAQARRSRALAEGWVKHVAARTALTDASVAGVGGTIVKELVDGGYHRYSGGLRALSSDVLYCLCYRSGDRDGSRAAGSP